MKNVILYKKELEITNYIKNVIATIKKKKINIGISGGKTWIKIYNLFKKEKYFDKKKFTLYLIDERCCTNNRDSNYYNCRKNLVHNKKNFHAMYINSSVKESISNYNRILPKTLDMIFVGLGKDGHVLSWFKNSNIWKLNKKIVYIEKNRKIVYSRLTLTKNYINKSKNIYLLINSINKKNIFINYLSKKKNIPAHELKIKKIFVEKKLFFYNKNNI